MTNLPIFVAGLARCGTSLAMQILEAAGVPCFGEYPAFEPMEIGIGRDVQCLLAKSGTAMKIIDPMLHDEVWPDRFAAKIIWLDRNQSEQAKSQVKFIRESSGLDISKNSWRGIKKALVDDRFKCVDWWNRCTGESLFLKFEDILIDPHTAAERMRVFLGLEPVRGWAEVAGMAHAVLSRHPRCQPDMHIEKSQFMAVKAAEKFGVPVSVALECILRIGPIDAR